MRPAILAWITVLICGVGPPAAGQSASGSRAQAEREYRIARKLVVIVLFEIQ